MTTPTMIFENRLIAQRNSRREGCGTGRLDITRLRLEAAKTASDAKSVFMLSQGLALRI